MQDTVYMLTFTADQALLLLAVIMVIALVGWLVFELFKSYSKIQKLNELLEVHNIDTESKKDELLVEKDMTIHNLRAQLGENAATIRDLMSAKEQKDELLGVIEKQNRFVSFLKGIHDADLDYHSFELSQLSRECDRLRDHIVEKDERIQELENVCAENGIEVIPLDMPEDAHIDEPADDAPVDADAAPAEAPTNTDTETAADSEEGAQN